MSRFLMCPPDFFSIEYEINPWMRISNQSNAQRVPTQWENLRKVLTENVGAKIECMDPVPGLPDMVFTANAGVIFDGKFVPSQFRHPERRQEEPHYTQWFTKKGYWVIPLDSAIHFEGAGDLLTWTDVWFAGYPHRSDLLVYKKLRTIFQKDIYPLELVDPRFHHLDICFCPLTGGELLYYPGAFHPQALSLIESHADASQRLAVPEHEAAQFACNAICVGRHVILPAGCPETMELLTNREYHPHPVDLDEFLKAGGSAKCLTLALD